MRGYFYNSKNILRLVNAPLFLLPCDLEKIKNLSLVFYSERKINYNLLYYLQKELGLAKGKLTDFLDKLENSKEIENWKNYLPFSGWKKKDIIAFLNNLIRSTPREEIVETGEKDEGDRKGLQQP